MMNKKLLLLFAIYLFCGFNTNGKAQVKGDRMTPEEYIALFKDAALTDMSRTGVPASITMAQGMYESDYGNSPLALNANNHFGIKCHVEWDGATYHQDDDAADECFRKYKNVQESYDDHSIFLRSRERYKSLFNLDITDYKGWARGLKKAGYATNPQYAQKLIDLIERYNLSDLDKQGTKLPVQIAELKKSPANISHNETRVNEKPLPGKNQSAFTSINTVNNVPFVRARKGDTWLKLTRENNLELWQILSYNDADKNAMLHDGELVFLKTKKNKSNIEKHVVKDGETMRSIAQLYGIKLKKLYRMNRIASDSQAKSGDILYLNKSLLFGLPL